MRRLVFAAAVIVGTLGFAFHARAQDNQCQAGTCDGGGGGYDVSSCSAQGITFCNIPAAQWGPANGWPLCDSVQGVAYEGGGEVLTFFQGFDGAIGENVYAYEAYFPWWYDYSYFDGASFCTWDY
jgi:hypothetical protein